jgi:hypothetical protein
MNTLIAFCASWWVPILIVALIFVAAYWKDVADGS